MPEKVKLYCSNWTLGNSQGFSFEYAIDYSQRIIRGDNWHKLFFKEEKYIPQKKKKIHYAKYVKMKDIKFKASVSIIFTK